MIKAKVFLHPPQSTISSLTTDSTQTRKQKRESKNEYITDASLGPDGKLSKRLFDPIKKFQKNVQRLLQVKMMNLQLHQDQSVAYIIGLNVNLVTK